MNLTEPVIAGAEKWLALFPLNTALFPDGLLPLRVFETRYIDMVRDCMKAASPFGVVAIRSGREVGALAEPYSVGTLASITEWDMPDFGVLLIQTRGGERFRILETRLLPNQRLEARIAIIAQDAVVESGDTLAVCSRVLRAVVDDLQKRARDTTGAGLINPFPQPWKFDDASWVGNRWCEVLPIALEEKQRLLEMTDAASRLEHVHHYLAEHGII